MLTISECDKLSMVWVAANVDFEKAAQSYESYPNTARWRERPDNYIPYPWAYDKSLGSIYALVTVRVDEVEPGEKEWNFAMQYESTQQYIKWFKEGHTPPPIFVVRHIDGHLVSLNRRRWLAAREAGVETLPAYYSPTKPNGREAWRRKLCYVKPGGNYVCHVYDTGGDCTTCQNYENFKAERE